MLSMDKCACSVTTEQMHLLTELIPTLDKAMNHIADEAKIDTA
jgi:hypothetical protein